MLFLVLILMFAAFGRVSPNYYCGITNYHTMCRLVVSTLLKKGTGMKKVNTIQNKDNLDIAKLDFFEFILLSKLCLFRTVIRLLYIDDSNLHQSCFYSVQIILIHFKTKKASLIFKKIL